MAGLTQEIEVPLPPRRPDLHVTAPTPAETDAAAPAAKPAPVVVASPAPEPAASAPERRGLFVPRLMQGATPILGTGRFYQPPAERQADRGSERGG